MVWVAVKTAAGLPASEPSSHSARGRIEEVLQRRGHIAEARGAAEHQRIGAPQLLQRCDTAAPARAPPRGAASLLAADGGHGAQRGAGAGHRFDAAACLPRQLRGAAVARVIDHQYFAPSAGSLTACAVRRMRRDDAVTGVRGKSCAMSADSQSAIDRSRAAAWCPAGCRASTTAPAPSSARAPPASPATRAIWRTGGSRCSPAARSGACWSSSTGCGSGRRPPRSPK